MKMFSKDGVEMMDVKAFDIDDDNLVMKGKMMGSMNTVIHIKPEDMAQVFSLMPWSVILRLPVLFIKGLFRKKPASTIEAEQADKWSW